jgi:Secretion system C-terminal sorting domain
MKYFLPLIVLFLATRLVAQPYLNETSQWKQYYRYSAYPPGIAFVEDILIQLDGDTMVGDVTYYRVLKTGLATTILLQSNDTTYQGPIHHYMDPIREEDKYIYAYDRAAGKEYLLYDFSAAVGDTLKSFDYCKRDTVISIDTLYLGDQPRKRFHLPSPYAGDISTLVEGIGSTFGFYWPVCNVIPDPQIKLQCFSQDGAFIQFDSTYDCNGLLLANKWIKEDKFSIHPNPFLDDIEIQFPVAFQQAVSITMVNMLGAVVFHQQLQSPGPVERLALPDLPAGVYVICIRNRQGISSYKMIKR